MAPTTTVTTAEAVVEKNIQENKIMVFSKSTCPFCVQVKELFSSLGLPYSAIELDQMEDGREIQAELKRKTGQATVPNVFINGEHVGGCSETLKAHKEEKLMAMYQKDQQQHSYDYDIVVIGGGSGGLAASKEAAKLGKKVAVCDFVVPTPIGTTWGLGGTCVNVGCIPKKLMHQAAMIGEALKDSREFGWEVPEKVNHSWEKMVEEIGNYIGSLNWGYRVALREKKVTYLNEFAKFVDPHTLKTVNKKKVEKSVTAKDFIIATGGRPRYPDIPGAKKYGITSDDIFSLPYCPGRTLLVGASYISLETAGFLHAMGLEVTVMVRSILLRGFDQEMANKIGAYMEDIGINFIRECVPSKLELVKEGKPGVIKVTAEYKDGTTYEDEFDTVIFAIGRDAETNIGLESIGVKLNKKNGRVIADKREQSSLDNIYAIGDILDGAPELTPVAIQAGKLLARRLCGTSNELCDYKMVPTTVFTPIEYGCCGYSEEDARNEFGEDDIEVYHSHFWPLEWTVAKRPENVCYAKLVCLKKERDRVIGFHYLGPNAGEVTQGYAGMLRLGATYKDFQELIGIHPTTAEVFTTLDITKSSGVDASTKGC